MYAIKRAKRLPRFFPFREALSILGLIDAIGLSTDEELVATELVRFITIGLDLDTTLFSSDCSCILFATLSVMQLSKLRFLAQQR